MSDKKFKKVKTSFLFYCLFVVFFLACSPTQDPKPEEIYKEDMCAQCRMAVSEKVFAAQIITKGGESLKFDDIGCFVLFLKKNAQEVTASFVVDYFTKTWIAASRATFVHSSNFKTPMNYGYAAFRDLPEAQKALKQFPGSIFSLSHLVERAE